MQNQIEFLQNEQIKITEKRTGNEHTSRVGYLVGPIVDRANMKWYEQTCKNIGKVNGDEIELKKELVYKGNEREWCITIHSMRSVKEKVDMAMQSIKFSEKSHVKYVSFANSTRNE